MNESSCYYTSSQSFGVSVLNFGPFNRHIVVSCFPFHLPDDIDGEHLVICLLVISISFGELSVKVFGQFSNKVVCFLIVEVLEFFVCFG